jgi:hypothetical protein
VDDTVTLGHAGLRVESEETVRRQRPVHEPHQSVGSREVPGDHDARLAGLEGSQPRHQRGFVDESHEATVTRRPFHRQSHLPLVAGTKDPV